MALGMLSENMGGNLGYLPVPFDGGYGCFKALELVPIRSPVETPKHFCHSYIYGLDSALTTSHTAALAREACSVCAILALRLTASGCVLYIQVNRRRKMVFVRARFSFECAAFDVHHARQTCFLRARWDS